MVAVALADGTEAVCDPCIEPLVYALNQKCGLLTAASCCGHGKRPGAISLADGRTLLVTKNDDEFAWVSGLIHDALTASGVGG